MNSTTAVSGRWIHRHLQGVPPSRINNSCTNMFHYRLISKKYKNWFSSGSRWTLSFLKTDKADFEVSKWRVHVTVTFFASPSPSPLLLLLVLIVKHVAKNNKIDLTCQIYTSLGRSSQNWIIIKVSLATTINLKILFQFTEIW